MGVVGDQNHETSACGALLVVRCGLSCIKTATLLLDTSGALIALQLSLVFRTEPEYGLECDSDRSKDEPRFSIAVIASSFDGWSSVDGYSRWRKSLST